MHLRQVFSNPVTYNVMNLLCIHIDYVDLTVTNDHVVSDNDSVDLPSPPISIAGLVHF